MNFSLARIKQVFPHFNERPISEHEFWRVSKREKIVVRSMPLGEVDGYYKRERGKHYILLNKSLTPTKWLHTALHEFSHYLFDVAGAESEALYRRQCGDTVDPRERFADAFALIGILPFPDLLELQREDLSDNALLSQLVRDRITVFTDFGL